MRGHRENRDLHLAYVLPLLRDGQAPIEAVEGKAAMKHLGYWTRPGGAYGEHRRNVIAPTRRTLYEEAKARDEAKKHGRRA